MSLPTPFELLPSWSDSWGLWNSRALAAQAWLENERCLKARLALAPNAAAQTIPLSGQIDYNVRLVPGSVVFGFVLPLSAAGSEDIRIQVTDVALNHQWFQEPLSLASLGVTGVRECWFERSILLPCPHPVVGDGLFRVELWGPVGSSAFIIFHVAEVSQCPRW